MFENIKRPMDLEEVESLIEYSNGTIMMAFGWLISEGHIHVHQHDEKFYICCSSDDKGHCPGGNAGTYS